MSLPPSWGLLIALPPLSLCVYVCMSGILEQTGVQTVATFSTSTFSDITTIVCHMANGNHTCGPSYMGNRGRRTESLMPGLLSELKGKSG